MRYNYMIYKVPVINEKLPLDLIKAKAVAKRPYFRD